MNLTYTNQMQLLKKEQKALFKSLKTLSVRLSLINDKNSERAIAMGERFVNGIARLQGIKEEYEALAFKMKGDNKSIAA